VLDCEDGVAVSKKEEARTTIASLLKELVFGASESVVRVNSADSAHAQEDLHVVLRDSEVLPDALMLPKIESTDQLMWFKHEVATHLQATGRTDTKFRWIGQCETPRGMMDLRWILDEAVKPHPNLSFETMVFGSDDYLASIGATRTKNAQELLFARQYFVMHVKGFNLQAIDMVDINFKDLDGLEEQAVEGLRMGFTGKQVIHPSQIDPVNRAFTPSPEQIEYALALVKQFQQHQQSHDAKGAFTFRGSMIDMPSVRQAQNSLNIVNSIGRPPDLADGAD